MKFVTDVRAFVINGFGFVSYFYRTAKLQTQFKNTHLLLCAAVYWTVDSNSIEYICKFWAVVTDIAAYNKSVCAVL